MTHPESEYREHIVRIYRHEGRREKPFSEPVSGILHSDERIRIWEMFDIGHTPEAGKWLMRIDIWERAQ